MSLGSQGVSWLPDDALPPAPWRVAAAHARDIAVWCHLEWNSLPVNLVGSGLSRTKQGTEEPLQYIQLKLSVLEARKSWQAEGSREDHLNLKMKIISSEGRFPEEA